ncbi:MAG: hypothetical protein ACE5K4_08600 [Candidatus Hydrothermarchaeota archaeon]
MVKSAGNISSEPILLPFQIPIVPNFVSTKENREPVVTAVVFGSQDRVRLSVSGHTAIHTIVIQPDPQYPVFQIEMPLSGVAPGTYNLQVKATEGVQTVTEKLTVVVNPSKSRKGG